MKPSLLTLDQFPRRNLFRGFEGGAVYLAEKDARFYVILDESSMAGILDEEDLQDMKLVSILEFDSEGERQSYLAERFAARPGRLN